MREKTKGDFKISTSYSSIWLIENKKFKHLLITVFLFICCVLTITYKASVKYTKLRSGAHLTANFPVRN